MKAKIKEKWVKALRSGEYKKGRYALRKLNKRKGATPKYCCLGVLCDLYIKEHKRAKWELDTVSDNNTYQLNNNGVDLPSNVRRWAGIKESNPLVGKCSLMSLNDFHNKSFKYIANVIEEEL